MNKHIEIFLAGIIIGVLVAILLMLSSNVTPFPFAATTSTQSPAASVTINAFVDTTISPASIAFGSLDPGTTNNAATSNPTEITNTANSNTAIDIYLNGTNLVSGGDTIPVVNLNVSKTAGGAQTSLGAGPWIANSTANTGYYENIAKGASSNFYFYVSVSAGQNSGTYGGTVTIKSVKDGQVP
jgi:hypothetical protein